MAGRVRLAGLLTRGGRQAESRRAGGAQVTMPLVACPHNPLLG